MISRRLGGALALCVMLAGCGGGANGGTQLVFARVKDAVDLDPAVATDGNSLNVSSLILQGLVSFKPGTFTVIPAVASSWTTSADGRTWTFKLKPDLKFSDGTALDAAAVKFNFDRWRNAKDPNRGNYQYSYWISQFGGFPGVVRDVRVDNPTQVTFLLTQPMGPFLRNLAMPSFAIASPTAVKAGLPEFDRKPVGSGPYLLGEWIKDDHITLTANPAYVGPKPAYATVIIRDIPDQATSVLSLQKGEIDGLADPRPEDAKTLGQQAGITIHRQPSNNISYLALNMDKKPFDDLRVRQALALAIDVPAIVKAFYSDGAVVADTWLPTGMTGSDPTMKAYVRNVAKAKALLASAGLASGFSTQLYYPTTPRPYNPEPQRVAEAIQANLRDIGVNVTLAPFEFGVFLQKVKNGEHPMCMIGWTGDNGDPDNFMYPLLDKDSAVKGGQNYSEWRDKNFHKLMIAGQTTISETARAEIYRNASKMVHDLVPAIPMVHTTVPLAMKSTVDGVIPRPDSILNFELMHPKT